MKTPIRLRLKFFVRRNGAFAVWGIWNNDMKAFQYVEDWNGTQTTNYNAAALLASKLNKAYNAQAEDEDTPQPENREDGE